MRLPSISLLLLFASLANADPSHVRIEHVSTKNKYTLGSANLGGPIYTDRRFTLSQFPEALVGQSLILTSNADDGVTDAKHLRLTLAKEATIYVCFDTRAKRPASWLVGWHLTDGIAKTTDTSFHIYRKIFAKGEGVLGGNERPTTGAMSNYFVLVVAGKHTDSLKSVRVVDKKETTNPRIKKNDPLVPRVPEGFGVSLFAREPLIRNPASLCFDANGRLYVGQGPQFRTPKPDTPGDTIEILIDSDGDGIADRTKTFAKGFNCIQGLAWKGNDLWVANSPDLTVVRDLDGDDEADEYVLLYTDLGNLEHALHGLNWGPDGKLYMSRGNSKGYDKDGRVAPQAFRELSGEKSRKGIPDLPPPKVFKKGTYRRSYHHPSDYWGRDGGVLRCDPMGKNLEIVSRGFRNPWDITFDDGFNWLGTDNDQDEGDRIFMPFFGAHFGWGHSWSYHWTGHDHPPTVPISAPVFHGSGTGMVYSSMRSFPQSHRGVFFINDWLRRRTWIYRPKWVGSLMQDSDGDLEEFLSNGGSLFRPTDIVTGPDGALYIGGWGKEYGVVWETVEGKRQQANEGRVFRVWFGDRPKLALAKRKPLAKQTFSELLEDLGPDAVPARRVNAQDELLRRGAKVEPLLRQALGSRTLDQGTETWTAWTLGRMDPTSKAIETYFANKVADAKTTSLNLRIQALRILAHRVRNFAKRDRLPHTVVQALNDGEPRIRFEAVQAIWQAGQTSLVERLLEVAAREKDRLTFYSTWRALGELTDVEHRKTLLKDQRPGVRFATMLSLLQTRSLSTEEAYALAERDTDPRVQEWALHYAINAIPAEVTSTRQDFSRFRLDFFDRALKQFSKSDNPKVRRSLLALLSRVHYKSEQWVPLRRFYTNLRTNPKVEPTELAYVLRALAKDRRSAPLLWEALREKPPLRTEAIVGFENLPEPEKTRAFLLEQFAKADHADQQRGALETLARLDVETPWSLNDALLERLTSQYRTSDDPRLRRAILSLLTRTDSERLRRNVAWRREILALVRSAADDADPRVHTLVAPLATKLGEAIRVTAKRTPVTIDAVMSLLPRADSKRGRALFLDVKRGNCLACHRVEGQGQPFAPPLFDIGTRAKLREIVESILAPNEKITEGYHVTNIVTVQGKPIVGVVRKETSTFVELFQQEGRVVEVAKSDIDEREVVKTSIMPGNFGELFAAEEIADLVAWLAEQKQMKKEPAHR